jgi:hypothetical protein
MATSKNAPERVVGPNPQTPPAEPAADEVKVDSSLTNDHDRIVMASRRVDGSINETDPEFIGPVEDAIRGAAHQKEFQARAAQTSARVAAQANKVAEAEAEPDEVAKRARKDAEAEVKKLHQGRNS